MEFRFVFLHAHVMSLALGAFLTSIVLSTYCIFTLNLPLGWIGIFKTTSFALLLFARELFLSIHEVSFRVSIVRDTIYLSNMLLLNYGV